MSDKEKIISLMQKLGNTINVVLGESDAIAQVFKEIDEAGYDTSLAIEVNMTYHKRPVAAAAPLPPLREPTALVDADGNVSVRAFTRRDKSDFLLRDCGIILDPEDVS